jgi:hypothetical protein
VDKKQLVEKLKAEGLNVAEEALKDTIEVAFKVGEEALKATKATWVPLAIGFLPMLKSFLLEAVDKIDGQVG